MKLTPSEEERYSRHFSLPGVGYEGQQKLKAARVLVIGAGGLGSPLSLYLAAAGIGHLTVMDPDHVSLSNLQRQILFRQDQISLPKATLAAEQLRALNSDIHVEGVNEKLTSSNAQKWVSSHDLVVDGSDNFNTRYLVNDACFFAAKPLVFGALARFDAQVSVLHFKQGPCYRCLYPEPPPVEATMNCSEAGVLGVLPGTVGTLMATEVLKIILGIGETLSGKLLQYDALAANFFSVALPKNKKCALCGADPRILNLPTEQETRERGLSWEEFEKAIEKKETLILDVRTTSEFAALSLKKSKNIPLAELDSYLHQQEKKSLEQAWIVVCQSGRRSARAVEILQQHGIQNAQHVLGGLSGRTTDHLISRSS